MEEVAVAEDVSITPLWEVIDDLAARCLTDGFRDEAELLYRMAQSMKAKGPL